MILKSLLNKILNRYNYQIESKNTNYKKYYSQEGEDIILERIFSTTEKGFFVDVGSHHPIRFSNTYKFYLKGWRGINIDATPGSMEPFNKIRPTDINIEMGIASYEGELSYYLFNEPALNTFSKERADFLIKSTPFKLSEVKKVKTNTLANVLNQHLSKSQKIDFLTIDVEGLDLEILKSNDWINFRPKVILVEDLNSSLEDINNSEVYQYLSKLDYKLVSRTFNTLFFKDSKN